MWSFSLPLAADREEWVQEAQVTLGMQKVLQSLGQAAGKLQQAVGRLRGQEEETWLQQSRNQSPQVWNHPRKVRLRGCQGDPREIAHLPMSSGVALQDSPRMGGLKEQLVVWEGSRKKEKESPFYLGHFILCVLGGSASLP